MEVIEKVRRWIIGDKRSGSNRRVKTIKKKTTKRKYTRRKK